MNVQTLSLQPGGQALSQSLGFGAAAVIVDNYTSSFVRIPDAAVDVPPWCYGRVIVLPPGVGRATASLISVTPATPGPPTPLTQATLTWVDQALAPNPGVLMQGSSYDQPQLLASIPTPQSSPATVSVPEGTETIAWAVTNPSGLNTGTLKIQGVQSSRIYVNTAVNGSSGAADSIASSDQFLVDPADTQLTITRTNSIGVVSVDVWSIPAGSTTSVVPAKEATFPVQAVATPAAWQAPNLAPIRIATTFPTTQAGATELIAGFPGQAIRIFSLSGAWDASAAASSLHLVDAAHGSPGAGTIRGDLSQAVQSPPPLGPLGPFTVGNSLYAFADSGTPVLRGTLSAGQA